VKNIAELIARTHSDNAATAFAEFRPTEAERNELAEVGLDVLSHCPVVPGSCALMTALFAARWRVEPRPPVYVVAGELYASGIRVFGSESMADSIDDDLKKSNPSWDGHFWLVFGPYIADISVFRTAYSKHSPPDLARHVKRTFPPRHGMLIEDQSTMESVGFRYVSHSVLDDDQVTAFALGAREMFGPR